MCEMASSCLCVVALAMASGSCSGKGSTSLQTTRKESILKRVIVNPEHVRNQDISKEVLAEKHQVRCKRFVDAHITKAFKGPKLEKVRFPICPFVDYRARLLVDSVNVSNRQHCQQRPYSETVPRKRVVRTSVEL